MNDKIIKTPNDLDNIALMTILFDEDNNRRKNLLSTLEAFARILWSKKYLNTSSTGGSFEDKELKVEYEWKK